jgi:hypothetical protein
MSELESEFDYGLEDDPLVPFGEDRIDGSDGSDGLEGFDDEDGDE